MNVLGIVIYLYWAPRTWAPHGGEGLLGGPGDPLIWALSAFPILVASLIINVVWMVLILLRWCHGKDWHSIVIWLTMVVLWGGVVSFDHSRQYNGSKILSSRLTAPVKCGIT